MIVFLSRFALWIYPNKFAWPETLLLKSSNTLKSLPKMPPENPIPGEGRLFDLFFDLTLILQ